MPTIRRWVRLALLILFCVLLSPLGLGVVLLRLVAPGRVGLLASVRLQALWSRGLLRIAGVRLDIESAPPRGPFVVVANHVSYVDIPVVASLFPGRFVAKAEIARWPVFGPLSRIVGTLFIQRERRRDVAGVAREIELTLERGCGVILFPEGGSSRGMRVERLHSSLLEPSVSAGVPCLPVAVGYETPADPWAPASTVCWWGGMALWTHLWGLLGLSEIRCRVRWASEPLVGRDRKDLARDLHAALERQFEPVRQAPISPDFAYPHLFEDTSPERA